MRRAAIEGGEGQKIEDKQPRRHHRGINTDASCARSRRKQRVTRLCFLRQRAAEGERARDRGWRCCGHEARSKLRRWRLAEHEQCRSSATVRHALHARLHELRLECLNVSHVCNLQLLLLLPHRLDLPRNLDAIALLRSQLARLLLLLLLLHATW